MPLVREQISADDEAELNRLCEEYRTLSSGVCKALHVGNPPDLGKVQLLLEAEANAEAMLSRIKGILGVG